jgi:hypothetical protein
MTIRSTRLPALIRSALCCALVVIYSVSIQSAAAAENNCDWYARTALRQQQDNDQRKCGFNGPAWSWDLKSHMAWCATANPDQWKAEAQQRERQLLACKPAS